MLDEFMHMVSDPAHLAFEFFSTVVFDVIILGVAWPFVKRFVRRHDKRVHGK